VLVKGAGVLDKRSFLASDKPGLARRLPAVTPSGDSSGGLPLGALGLASVGLLLVAIMLFAPVLRRGRSDRR